MILSRFARFVRFALVLCAVSVSAAAQQTESSSTFEPTIGQKGKDVVWVPTPQVLVDKMLDIAKVTPKDYVIDLGSGDGRTVITAAKRGVRALGIEYDPDLVALSKRNAEKEGVADKAQFVKADLFRTDLSQATVITMFLLQDINLKLRPTILGLKPGTRVVSNTFDMGEWKPDLTANVDNLAECRSWCSAHLWIVPAKVEGKHKVAQGELSLKQRYQMLSGTLRSAGKAVPVEGKVVGEEIFLNAGGRQLRGRVNGKRIEMQ